MIRITDINGLAQLIAPLAIARLVEAGTSSQWHGINTYVHLFDGAVVEARETMADIARQKAGVE